MGIRRAGLLVACIALSINADTAATRAAAPSFTKVYPLTANEGVFAYARISPNGQILAYASEMPPPGNPRAIFRTITVVDLTTKKIQFSEPGIDAYFSNDGTRMIYLSQAGAGSGVTIRHQDTGVISRRIAPVNLGDYFSWSVRDGRNMILTIQSNYYYLDGDNALLPNGKVLSCPDIGTGERPLISKDGRRITTFVRGAVVVRGLNDCNNIVDTGIQGGKADFSFDGRYVAFHAPKPNGAKGYDIVVVDVERKTIRTITNMPGTSLFPSWTQDGRLCFRYDGSDYRGFMMADNVLSAPERPLPAGGAKVPPAPKWSELFPETPAPAHRTNIVMVWAPWSAHSPDALRDLQQARDMFDAAGQDIGVFTAVDMGSIAGDVARMRRQNNITLPQIPLAPARLAMTEALNQIPTSMVFHDGVLVDRRLGAQTLDALREWVGSFTSPR